VYVYALQWDHAAISVETEERDDGNKRRGLAGPAPGRRRKRMVISIPAEGVQNRFDLKGAGGDGERDGEN